jgi:hypothetical protein
LQNLEAIGIYLAKLLAKHWCVIEWWAILGKNRSTEYYLLKKYQKYIKKLRIS